MHRLLILAPLPVSAASTRFRLAQYFPALRSAGIEPVLSPFLQDEGASVLYSSGRGISKARAAVSAVARRFWDLVRAQRADAVLIHREAALIGPPIVEWIISHSFAGPVLFDIDDAVWVPYASPTYGALLSRLLKSPDKSTYTTRHAAAVLAGNPHVAKWAKMRNSNVHLFPTVVDTRQFVPRPRTRKVPVLGWIGTHSTVQYLHSISPVLQRLAKTYRFVLRVVGGSFALSGVEVDCKPWDLSREIADFQDLDIGLYPLIEDDWSVGKSAFKAIEYMACGIPVVASPVGFTKQVVRHDVTGFWAQRENEWYVALSGLLDDAGLRSRMGAAGRSDAMEKWSLDVYSSRFVDLIRSVMATHRS